MDDVLKNILIDLLAPPGIEATIEDVVNIWALASAGMSADIRAKVVACLHNEIIGDMSKLDEFRGKELAPIADFVADRLAKRIAEIEASGAGRA